LERDPRAVLVPAAVRAVGRARRTGDALAARGIAD
ncbi:energy-coupling factor transporter transmembrane protein EcfT, partial [Actinotalea ferrariae]|nr:energy-coupling factor transporter transmembrane protein EcfT [Actinotalea ferrariae]